MNLLLHVRVRVVDLERSITWYKENLGFELVRRTDRSLAGNQLAFIRLPGSEVPIEFCYSPDYELAVPEDLMHFAIGVPNLSETCGELEAKGIELWPANWRAQLAAGRKMAFITDPDGYEIELLETRN